MHKRVLLNFTTEKAYNDFRTECFKMGFSMNAIMRILINKFISDRKNGKEII